MKEEKERKKIGREETKRRCNVKENGEQCEGDKKHTQT
jgi:hypothetical protein